MMSSGNLPNNGNIWQTTEPMKLETKVPASDKHYWLTPFGKHLSPVKLQTVDF